MFFICFMDSNSDDRKITLLSHFYSIAAANHVLQSHIKDFIIRKFGESAEWKTVDITNQKEIIEPDTDGIVVYRDTGGSSFSYIYQRKTKIIPGYIYGQTLATEFNNIVKFCILEYHMDLYTNNTVNTIDTVEEVPIINKPTKQFVTVSDILEELRSLPRFRAVSMNRNNYDEN